LLKKQIETRGVGVNIIDNLSAVDPRNLDDLLVARGCLERDQLEDLLDAGEG